MCVGICCISYLKLGPSVKYADDMAIFYSNKDAEVIQIVLNNEFSSMTNWLRNNDLIINTKRGKTEVTLYGTSKRLCKLNNPRLKIVNSFETINYTKSYKYLGLILNETLNMSEHKKVTMKKARSIVNLLRRIRPLIDPDTASLIFKVMILPRSGSRLQIRLQQSFVMKAPTN